MPLQMGSHTLDGRWTTLRPINPDDYATLFHMATDPRTIQRWRFRGGTPSYEDFLRHLWDKVLSQFVVVSKASGEILSLVVAYGADHRNGNAYLAVLKNPESTNASSLEGVLIFLNYLFSTFPLRKLYLEVPEFNLTQFSAGVGTIMQSEGVLKEHDYFEGRYWDLHILAIYRDRIEGAVERLASLGRTDNE